MTALVLIVEDNSRNLKLVRDLLDFAGYRTVTAGSAEDGLDLARAHRPDLVLMDVQLPGMDGIEALRHLRADLGDVPVVALTAFAMKDDRERFLAVGFDAYIEKPLDVREFPRQVAAILGQGATA